MMRVLPIAEISASEYNPRIDLTPDMKEYQEIKSSLELYGYVEPIVVNDVNMRCVGGHQRLAVMRDLGVKTAMCSVVHIEDEQREMELCLALNKIKGRWDEDKLDAVIASLDEDEYPISYDPVADLEKTIETMDDGLPDTTGADSDDVIDDVEEPTVGNVPIKIGSYSFVITMQEYDDMIASIRDEGFFSTDEIVAEIQRRLTARD